MVKEIPVPASEVRKVLESAVKSVRWRKERGFDHSAEATQKQIARCYERLGRADGELVAIRATDLNHILRSIRDYDDETIGAFDNLRKFQENQLSP